MITKLPTDRPLPHKQEILERILADDAAPARHRRGWLVPVSAAASVGVFAGGLLVATTGHDKTQPGPAATHPPTATTPTKRAIQAAPDIHIHINLGPLTAAETTKAAQTCLAKIPGSNHATGLAHGVKVMTWGRVKTESTVVFTTVPENLRYGYNSRNADLSIVGGDPAVAAESKTTLTMPDATHPAASTDSSDERYLFVNFDGTPAPLVQEGWYVVDDRVAAMRQRWFVHGKPSAWYVAEPVDGLVFLRSWVQASALKVGDEVRVETQVLDKAGRLLDAPADLKGGGGLLPSPGTTRVDKGTVVKDPSDSMYGTVNFKN